MFPGKSSKAREAMVQSKAASDFEFFGAGVQKRIMLTEPGSGVRRRAVNSACEAYKLIEWLKRSSQTYYESVLQNDSIPTYRLNSSGVSRSSPKAPRTPTRWQSRSRVALLL